MRIPGGDQGTAVTLRVMYGVVAGNEGAANGEIRRQAIEITRNVASRDQQGEIAAVLQWVKTNIKFRGEYKETIQTPLVTLQLRAGDCYCQTALIAALLASLGYKTRFKTVAADPSAPWAYSHVFTEIFQRKTGQWISLDSTVPNSYPGWQPARIFRQKTWQGFDAGHPQRRLGDPPDPGTINVPGGTGSAGQVTKTQAFLQLTTPIAQALANRIQYGNNTPRSANLNLGLNTTSLSSGGISPTMVYVGGAAALGVILLIAARGGRN